MSLYVVGCVCVVHSDAKADVPEESMMEEPGTAKLSKTDKDAKKKVVCTHCFLTHMQLLGTHHNLLSVSTFRDLFKFEAREWVRAECHVM